MDVEPHIVIVPPASVEHPFHQSAYCIFQQAAQQDDRKEHVPIAVVAVLEQQGNAHHACAVDRTAGSQQKATVGDAPFPDAHI